MRYCSHRFTTPLVEDTNTALLSDTYSVEYVSDPQCSIQTMMGILAPQLWQYEPPDINFVPQVMQ